MSDDRGARAPRSESGDGGDEGMSPELARFFDAMRPYLAGEEPPRRFVERLGPSPSGERRLSVYPRLVALDWIGVIDKLYEATRYAIESHFDGLARIEGGKSSEPGKSAWRRLRAELGRAHPPTHWDINEYGRPFPEWIASRRDSGENLPGFVDQLADFEWLEFSTWSAPDVPAVAKGDRPIVEPTVSVRQYSFPVPAYARAVRRGEKPPAPAEKATTVVVYRRADTLLVHLFYPSVAGLLVLAHASGEVDADTLAKAGVTPDMRKSAENALYEHKILRRETTPGAPA